MSFGCTEIIFVFCVQLRVDILLAIQVGFLLQLSFSPEMVPAPEYSQTSGVLSALRTQGEALIPGERAESIERFTPADGLGVVFIKLADGRGWVPVRKRNGSFGVTPTDH